MTDKLFYMIFTDALGIADRAAFISDWALSSVWGDAEDDEIPASRLLELGMIWDVAHASFADIVAASGLKLVDFAARFAIPYHRAELEAWRARMPRLCAAASRPRTGDVLKNRVARNVLPFRYIVFCLRDFIYRALRVFPAAVFADKCAAFFFAALEPELQSGFGGGAFAKNFIFLRRAFDPKRALHICIVVIRHHNSPPRL